MPAPVAEATTLKEFEVGLPYLKGLTYQPEQNQYDGTRLDLRVMAENDEEAIRLAIGEAVRLRDAGMYDLRNVRGVEIIKPEVSPRHSPTKPFRYFGALLGPCLYVVRALSRRQAENWIWPQCFDVEAMAWCEISIKYHGPRPKIVARPPKPPQKLVQTVFRFEFPDN